jgi:hypothetical protein
MRSIKPAFSQDIIYSNWTSHRTKGNRNGSGSLRMQISANSSGMPVAIWKAWGQALGFTKQNPRRVWVLGPGSLTHAKAVRRASIPSKRLVMRLKIGAVTQRREREAKKGHESDICDYRQAEVEQFGIAQTTIERPSSGFPALQDSPTGRVTIRR